MASAARQRRARARARLHTLAVAGFVCKAAPITFLYSRAPFAATFVVDRLFDLHTNSLTSVRTRQGS